ncbi:hypothetical protein TNCV_2369751 [Trichonephila clavipes]|nr:hypothetical protein TNCV_2369751 [Trichonephila clavipes]
MRQCHASVSLSDYLSTRAVDFVCSAIEHSVEIGIQQLPLNERGQVFCALSYIRVLRKEAKAHSAGFTRELVYTTKMIDESFIREWTKNEMTIINIPQNKCNLRKATTKWPILEESVTNWGIENHQNGLIPTRNSELAL